MAIPPPLPRLRSNLVRGGLFCLLMGFLTFWVLGLGFAFFSAAMIIGIVAMCKDQVKEGILLFVGSLVSIVVCKVGLFGLVMAVIASIFGAALDEAKASAPRIATTTTQPAGVGESSPPRPALATTANQLMTKGLLKGSQMIAGDLTPLIEDHNKKVLEHVAKLRKKAVPAPDYQTLQRRKELEELRARQGDGLAR